MFLTKRYFDVVSEDVAWAIAYDIAVPFAGVTLRYREMTSTGIAGPRWNMRLRRADAPAHFRFSDIGATWTDERPAPEAYFDNDVLTWRLTQLRSRVVVETNSHFFEGLGYGETLTLKCAPWLLGIRELWWGRYLSAQTFLTWIIADGNIPIRFGVHDRLSTSAVAINESTISIGEASLHIGEERCRIASGDVFAGRPRLALLASRVMGGRGLAIRQDKAIYQATVSAGCGRESGLAVAEHVVFGPLLGC